MAIPDVAAKLAGSEETHLHHYVFKRWYTPLPMIHVSFRQTWYPYIPLINCALQFVGMMMVISMSVFVHTVIVLGPANPPSPETLISILKMGKVDGALLAPVSIE